MWYYGVHFQLKTMPQKTFASLFSCTGCVDQLAESNGYLHKFAVEYDSEMANLFHRNYKDVPLFVQDVINFSPPACTIDWLHASPPCVLDSGARMKEITADELAAQSSQMGAVFKIVRDTRAKFISIENVAKFFNSKAFREFHACMLSDGYKYHSSAVNSKNLGIGQERVRSFCFYYRDIADTPTLTYGVKKLASWFEAFNLAELEEVSYSHIKPVQKVVDTLVHNELLAESPYLIERVAYRNNAPQYRGQSQNMWTIKSAIADDYRKGKGRSKYLLIVDTDLKGYNVHHDQLKLLQGFSKDFYLGDNPRIAVRAIGNACPPQMLHQAIKNIR